LKKIQQIFIISLTIIYDTSSLMWSHRILKPWHSRKYTETTASRLCAHSHACIPTHATQWFEKPAEIIYA